MFDNQTVVEYLVKDNSTGTLKQIESAHRGVESQTKRSTTALSQLDNVGRVSGRTLVYMGESALKGASGLETMSVATNALSYAPGIIGAVAVAVSLAVVAIDSKRKADEAALKPMQDYLQLLDDLDKAHSPLAIAIQNNVGLTSDEADNWAKAAAISDQFRDALKRQEQAHLDLQKAQQQQISAPDWLKALAGGRTGESIFGEIGVGAPGEDTSAARWQGLGEKYQRAEMGREAARILAEEQSLKSLEATVKKTQEAWDKYKETMKDLGIEHAKTLKELTKAENLARAEENTAYLELQDKLAKQIRAIDENLARQKIEIAYDYNQQLEALLYSRYQEERDTVRRLAEIDADYKKAVRGSDEQLQDDLSERHTEREREKAKTAALFRRRDIEETRSERLRELAQAKADRDEDFRRQKDLLDEQNRHARQNVLDAAEQQKVSAREAAAEQGRAISETLTKTLNAIQERRDKEVESYQSAQTKAVEAFNAIAGIETRVNTVRSEGLRLLMAQLEVMNLLSQKGYTSASSAPATPGNYNPKLGGEYQGGTHGWKTVPTGFSHDDYLIGLSSGERFNVVPAGRSGGFGGTINLYTLPHQDNYEIAQMVIRELRR